MIAQQLFDRFRQENKRVVDLYTRIMNGFYWHAGNYSLTLQVEVGHPAQAPRKTWHLSLSPKEEQDLRLNVIGLLQDICGLAVTYNFSYLPYGNFLPKPA